MQLRPPFDLTMRSCGLTTTKSLVLSLVFLEQNAPDLAAIVRAWPVLPEPVRAGILAMVKASE